MEQTWAYSQAVGQLALQSLPINSRACKACQEQWDWSHQWSTLQKVSRIGVVRKGKKDCGGTVSFRSWVQQEQSFRLKLNPNQLHRLEIQLDMELRYVPQSKTRIQGVKHLLQNCETRFRTSVPLLPHLHDFPDSLDGYPETVILGFRVCTHLHSQTKAWVWGPHAEKCSPR